MNPMTVRSSRTGMLKNSETADPISVRMDMVGVLQNVTIEYSRSPDEQPSEGGKIVVLRFLAGLNGFCSYIDSLLGSA